LLEQGGVSKFVNLNPLLQLKPHPSILERNGVEINDTSIDNTNRWIYAAAGDLFGCYQWDLETGQLRQTLSGGLRHQSHSDFLHSVCAIGQGGTMVLTGGEDGNLGVWDGKVGKLVDKIDCVSAMNAGRAPVRSDFESSEDVEASWKWGKGQHLWISSMDIDKGGNWAAICGGAEGKGMGSGSRRKGSSTTTDSTREAGGFVALWNVPTRSLISACATREHVQAVTFHESLDRLLTCGNEPVVSYWSPSDIVRQERAWLSSPSGFCVAVSPVNGVMAAGGASPNIDCFTDVGSKAFSMSFL